MLKFYCESFAQDAEQLLGDMNLDILLSNPLQHLAGQDAEKDRYAERHVDKQRAREID